MRMTNLLQLNDLDIKSFLKVILAIQLAMLGVIGLDTIGLDIPILRPIVGFIYLTFVPGTIILRILKIHSIDNTKFILYSAALSITFIMFAGALTNSLLHSLRISQPISTLPLTVTLSFFVALLCVVAYIRDRAFQPSEIENVNTNNLLSPPYLFLLLLPFIAIFGTFFINYYQNNTLLLLLLCLIAIIAALIAFDKFIPAKAYSVAIFTIAFSILLQVSLISPYPLGWNIDTEYYCSELIVTNGYWDSSLQLVVNSLLSIVMLAPIYSKMLGINIIWVLKVVYPFIHSLLPLAMFTAFREQMDAKKAFFSSFFFMSLAGFFGSMVFFRREQIALLFLALLVLVMLDNKLTSIQRSVLTVVFIVSLPVSHYGIAYISLTLFFFGWTLLLYLTSNKQTIFSKKIHGDTENLQRDLTNPSILKFGMTLVGLVFMLSWFMYIAGGTSFEAYVNVFNRSLVDLKDFFNPEARSSVVYNTLGMGLTPKISVLGHIFRIIHYATEVFLVAGFITLIIRPKVFKLKEEYRALLISTGLLINIIMFFPYLEERWRTFRFYSFVLVIVAPLIVFGCEAIWKLISGLIKSNLLPLINKSRRQESTLGRRFHSRNNQPYIKFLAIAILTPYFLFNIGVIHEIAENYVDAPDAPRSIPLNRWNDDTMYYTEREVSGAEWLDSVSPGKDIIVATDLFVADLISFWFHPRTFSLQRGIPEQAYIYLKTWNIEKQVVMVKGRHINPDDIPKLRDAINIRNKIYDNGGAQILAPARISNH